MIFLNRARLVILSQPKTGTTALESALAQRASISISKPPELKHMSYRGFMQYIAPFIEAQSGFARSDYEVVAVMREPVDWLGSWYRYRTRDELRNPDNPRSINFTGGMTFDQFVEDVCRPGDRQPAHAQIKTPSWVALADPGAIGVDRLFPYETLSGLYDLIAKRSGKPVDTRMANVSPEMKLSLSSTSEERLRRHFSFEFELHANLSVDGTLPDRFRPARGRYAFGTDDLSPAA